MTEKDNNIAQICEGFCLRCPYYSCSGVLKSKGIYDYTPWVDTTCSVCHTNCEIKCISNKRVKSFSQNFYLHGGNYKSFNKLDRVNKKPFLIVIEYDQKKCSSFATRVLIKEITYFSPYSYDVFPNKNNFKSIINVCFKNYHFKITLNINDVNSCFVIDTKCNSVFFGYQDNYTKVSLFNNFIGNKIDLSLYNVTKC